MDGDYVHVLFNCCKTDVKDFEKLELRNQLIDRIWSLGQLTSVFGEHCFENVNRNPSIYVLLEYFPPVILWVEN